ncbi:MAG: sulfatase-like hydrolase/transferase [Vicinamibacteria bacterium]
MLVTIDTLRADHVGAYGSTLAVTPNIDAMAQRGWVFENTVSAVPLTLPSHSTLLSGLDPLHHGVRNNGRYVFPADRETLATRLKANGYATGAFVSAVVLDRRFGLSRGFDVYDDQIGRVTEGRNILESERPCRETTAKAISWIKDQKGAFFAWVHLYEPHAPYVARPSDPKNPLDPYSAEVFTADACFGDVVRAAQSAAGADLVTAVTSDHGEGLGDHGEMTHGLFLYQSTLAVPMILAGDGVPVGKRTAGLARSADLVPTLMSLLGLVSPTGLDGRDLTKGAGRTEAYAETDYPKGFGWSSLRSWRLGALKLVDAPQPELYDLASDPHEEKNLAVEKRADLRRLEAVLHSAQATEVRDDARKLDPETEERLRSLGYVAGAPSLGDDRAVRTDPKDAALWLRQFEEAMTAEARGDLARSVDLLSSLAKNDPTNTTFQRSLASALRRSQRASEAVQILRRAQKASPRDAEIAHDLSMALSEQGNTVQAIESEQVAVALDPKDVDAFNHLATLEAARGDLSAARVAVDQALTLDPNHAVAWSNRGNIARGQGDVAQAERSYKRAIELAPQTTEALNGLGVLAVEQGRLDDAAGLLEKVLAIDPAFDEARLNLAVVEAQRGNTVRARGLATQVATGSGATALKTKARSFLGTLSGTLK